MAAAYNGDTLYMDIVEDRVSIGICDGGKEAHTSLTFDEATILGAQLLRSRLEKVENNGPPCIDRDLVQAETPWLFATGMTVTA